MKKKFLLLSLITSFAIAVSAQQVPHIKFNLALAGDGTYTVSFRSDTTFTSAKNRSRIGTGAQATIIAPTGFVLTNLKQLATTMSWDSQSVSKPVEAPTKDYFFFGLSNGGGYTLFDINANTDYPIFSFKSGNGCVGELHLIDNNNDPMLPSNVESLNVGNHVFVLGNAGVPNNESYIGNTVASATCAAPPTLTVTYPSPFSAGTAAPLTFTTTNSSGNPAQSGLGFTYTLPAGVTFAGTPNITNSCGGTPTISGNTITFTGGSIASGTASCVVTANIVAAAAGPITPTAANVTSTTGVTNGTPATQTITVGAAACAANAGTLGY